MAKKYKDTFVTRLGNFFVSRLLRAGIKMGNMALLTVRGRKSGLPRTTPIALGNHDGQRWIIAPYGAVNWVRNLRAAGEATLTQGRKSEHIMASELSIEEAAPILKKSLAGAPTFVQAYFDVNPASPL
ncbi:MAG TPA: nitroreductase family deazaflavin-dependent oxidoreductase, partial [Ktedonobacteraceae bacterium]|nr:nitroreductase family deazaflavin-dependent oxidoreductase [Ktedonobacteraceae bacterium]